MESSHFGASWAQSYPIQGSVVSFSAVRFPSLFQRGAQTLRDIVLPLSRESSSAVEFWRCLVFISARRSPRCCLLARWVPVIRVGLRPSSVVKPQRDSGSWSLVSLVLIFPPSVLRSDVRHRAIQQDILSYCKIRFVSQHVRLCRCRMKPSLFRNIHPSGIFSMRRGAVLDLRVTYIIWRRLEITVI